MLRLPCCGESGPDPDLFLRAAVAPRRPCLLAGAGRSVFSPAAPWSEELFLELAGGPETVVTVAETPHGRADAVVPFEGDERGERGNGGGGGRSSSSRVFAQPRESKMKLAELLHSLHEEASSSPPPVIRYAQRQNDSAADEFRALLHSGAVPRRLPSWAERAFSDATAPATATATATVATSFPRPSPDAVNLWVGGPRSATSWHRDHYENVHFCVLGEKTFHLLPPSDGWRLERRRWRAARYEERGAAGSSPCRSRRRRGPSAGLLRRRRRPRCRFRLLGTPAAAAAAAATLAAATLATAATAAAAAASTSRKRPSPGCSGPRRGGPASPRR